MVRRRGEREGREGGEGRREEMDGKAKKDVKEVWREENERGREQRGGEGRGKDKGGKFSPNPPHHHQSNPGYHHN